MSDVRPPPAIHAVARTLIEALPFMRRYQGAVMVIKYGGHAMGDEDRGARLRPRRGPAQAGRHQPGRGPRRRAADQGHARPAQDPVAFVDGLRVTDAATVEVVEMVLAGKINKEIVTAIQAAGGKAVGISGKDGRLIEATKLTRTSATPDSNIEQVVDLGFVGEPERINTGLLDVFRNTDIIPVIAPSASARTARPTTSTPTRRPAPIGGALRAASS